jgi:hypothetical protein
MLSGQVLHAGEARPKPDVGDAVLSGGVRGTTGRWTI